tara:strand:- start:652 stop:870 length:219 start_codon:yes stop_codon:yes gene_type:complete
MFKKALLIGVIAYFGVTGLESNGARSDRSVEQHIQSFKDEAESRVRSAERTIRITINQLIADARKAVRDMKR